MAKSDVNIYVKCPYYRKDDRQRIVCEGLGAGNSIQMVFDNQSYMKSYEKAYCKRCWKDCCIAQMLNKKWDYIP